MNENLKKLLLARQVMEACNDAHNHEIFMDPFVNREDEVITFDILPSNIDHVSDLTRLLNLIFNWTEGNELRKTIYYIS